MISDWEIWNWIMGDAEGGVLGHLMCSEHIIGAIMIDGNT